jgi:hypothetical protein
MFVLFALLIGGDVGNFTDPDGFAWEAVERPAPAATQVAVAT